MAGEYNITLEKGSTFLREKIYSDDDSLPYNLTGYSAVLEITKRETGCPFYLLSTSNGRIIITGAIGKIELKLTAEETSQLDYGNFYYKLKLISGVTVDRLIEGEFNIQ